MAAGWGELMRGDNAGRGAVVGFGMIIHAVNTFIVITILPSIVRDIGGLRFLAWSTTLYVVASLLAGAVCARILARIGPQWIYRAALGVFASGCVLCALAPSIGVLLAGRFAQGLGAGTLSALSFTMVRLLFAERLWPRALAVISGAWGVATLLGPAVGGVFAEYTGWRPAFWTLAALAPCLLILVERCLPRDLPRIAAPSGRLAYGNLLLLAGSVLAVSVGSMSARASLNATGLAIACLGLAVFAGRETRAAQGGGARLLPRGACSLSRPLGAAYASMALLMIGTTTEIFVPYFLQTLHAMTPLHAGYLSALMAGGWTAGSLAGSGASGRLRRAALLGGPAMLGAGLVGLAILMPRAPTSLALLVAMAPCLTAIGLGIGLCWPHIGARVYGSAPEGERELASSSITVVIMVSNAFGSAFGGMVTNLAGLTEPGGVAGAASSAFWLFASFAAAPAAAALVIRKLNAALRPVAELNAGK